MIMVLKLISMFAVIVVSPVSSVQLTFTRDRVIIGAPGETVMTCAVDETDIRDIYSMQVSVYSKTFPKGKVIVIVTRTGLDDATNANLGDLANRIRIEGSIATNLRDSRITVTFDTEKLQCADAAYYECSVSYLNNAAKPVTVTHSVNKSLDVYEYPVMGKLIVKHSGIEINVTSSRHPTFKVGDQIELSCSANVGSINTTLIQWRRTTEIGRENIWNEYQPSAAASDDGGAIRESCGYLRTATMFYNMTIADANRLNNLGFECYVRVSDPIYNNYVTPDSTNPKFYADVSGVNGGNAQQNASTDSTKCTQKGDCIGYKSDCIDGSCNCAVGYTLHTNGKDCQQNNCSIQDCLECDTAAQLCSVCAHYLAVDRKSCLSECKSHSIYDDQERGPICIHVAAATPNNNGAIIGGAVGGGVACAIILAVAILFIWRHRIRKGNGETPSVLNDTTANYTDLQTSKHVYTNKTSDYSELSTRPDSTPEDAAMKT